MRLPLIASYLLSLLDDDDEEEEEEEESESDSESESESDRLRFLLRFDELFLLFFFASPPRLFLRSFSSRLFPSRIRLLSFRRRSRSSSSSFSNASRLFPSSSTSSSSSSSSSRSRFRFFRFDSPPFFRFSRRRRRRRRRPLDDDDDDDDELSSSSLALEPPPSPPRRRPRSLSGSANVGSSPRSPNRLVRSAGPAASSNRKRGGGARPVAIDFSRASR
eukprot:11823-Pelagococcus_subviridis.AAC.5